MDSTGYYYKPIVNDRFCDKIRRIKITRNTERENEHSKRNTFGETLFELAL